MKTSTPKPIKYVKYNPQTRKYEEVPEGTKGAIKMYWVNSAQRYVTIPEAY